jgi:hypothetical protein
MREHVTHILSKASPVVAKQSSSLISPAVANALFRSFVWPHLEYGSLVLAMLADEPQLERLEKMQQKFVTRFGITMDSLKIRRSVAFCSLIYRIVVCDCGPQMLNERWVLAEVNPDLRRSSRIAESRHKYQLKAQIHPGDPSMRVRYIHALQLFNDLPPRCFPSTPSVEVFKKNVAAFFCQSNA